MFVIGVEASIGGKRFKRVHEVEITHSLKQLGKRAVVKIPASARLTRLGELVSEVETAKAFRVGDLAVIWMGYDGQLREEFRGYVRRIRPTVPLEIELEDETFKLRRKQLQKAWHQVTLRQLLDYILEGTGIALANTSTVPEINFQPFAFRSVNGAQALEKLRSDYGLTMYFSEPGRLVVGLASETDGTVVKYTIGRNVIEHDLEWVDEDDTQIKIKAVLVNKDNTFTEKIIGDEDGEQRTIFLYNIAPGELEERAKQEALKYKYRGYKGSLTGFLRPAAEVGNTVRLRDETFENNEGDYLVDEVVTSLSDSGGRRKVTLGLKLN
jgi:hypothetical protein